MTTSRAFVDLESLQHLRGALPAEHADDQHPGPFGAELLADGSRGRMGASDVLGPVEEHEGSLADDLEASRRAHRRGGGSHYSCQSGSPKNASAPTSASRKLSAWYRP